MKIEIYHLLSHILVSKPYIRHKLCIYMLAVYCQRKRNIFLSRNDFVTISFMEHCILLEIHQEEISRQYDCPVNAFLYEFP